MPFVTGFLRVRRRGRPGHPDIGLPDPEHPVDPGYGIEEGEDLEIGGGPIVPPGIWPPPNLGLPPGTWPPPGRPGHPIERPPSVPPGTVWPPLEPPTVGGGPVVPPPIVGGGPVEPPFARPPSGKIWALAAVGVTGSGEIVWRYVAADLPPFVPGQLPTGQPEPRR